jgi:hypothetical protein
VTLTPSRCRDPPAAGLKNEAYNWAISPVFALLIFGGFGKIAPNHLIIRHLAENQASPCSPLLILSAKAKSSVNMWVWAIPNRDFTKSTLFFPAVSRRKRSALYPADMPVLWLYVNSRPANSSIDITESSSRR